MFCINVWLTVKNESDTERVKELLSEAMRLSREEPGCERFEVYQSEADRSRFLLCEHWSDRAAWETHRDAEAFTTIYAPQVLPLVDRDPHISEKL